MKYEYSVHIAWSEEDQAYLAGIVELPGCMADGETQEQALSNIKEIAQEWIKVAKEEGRDIPRPMSVQDCDKAGREFQKRVNAEIQRRVEAAIQQAVSQAVPEALGQLRSFFERVERQCPERWRKGVSFQYEEA